MSQIFKVSLLNNDKSIKKIYAFVGSRFDYNPEVSGNIASLFSRARSGWKTRAKVGPQ